MIRLLKYFLYTLFIPFWWIQRLIPRNENIWVFGAWYGKKYNENTKALFEYILSDDTEIRPIWITKNKIVLNQLLGDEKPVYYYKSLKGIYYSLIAGKIIYSSGKVDVNQFVINGAILINTWHGSPMKKIGLDDKFASISRFKTFLFKYFFPFVWEFNCDYVVSSAKFFDENLSSAFDISNEKILLSGYPRCDVLFKPSLHDFTRKINAKFGNPLKILYLPTFRSLNEAFRPFDSFGFDEDIWSKFLERKNAVLISKGHFVDKVVSTKSTHDRIIHVSDTDVSELYELLKDIDILVTDYSGVYFDFLLTGKPVILAPFDFDSYLAHSRELYRGYEETSSGVIVYDWQELYQLLDDGVDTIKRIEIYNNKRNSFNDFVDADNSKRLMNLITEL